MYCVRSLPVLTFHYYQEYCLNYLAIVSSALCNPVLQSDMVEVDGRRFFFFAA